MISSVAQKFIASGVNCSLVFAISWPFRSILSPTGWKFCTVLIFWTYCIVCAGNDVGMLIAGTKCEPTGLLAATAYTTSFSSLLFRIRYPFDLMIINGTMQIASLAIEHNTLHGLIAGYRTMTQ